MAINKLYRRDGQLAIMARIKDRDDEVKEDILTIAFIGM